ncbi:hypothetical protein D3C76_1436870 [compost metagenome]
MLEKITSIIIGVAVRVIAVIHGYSNRELYMTNGGEQDEARNSSGNCRTTAKAADLSKYPGKKMETF